MATIRYQINWPKLNRMTRNRAQRVMRLVVAETRIVARRNCLHGPYTTGRLARSIYGTLRPSGRGGFIGRVGSDLPYATFPESGTRRGYPIVPRSSDPRAYLYFYWRRAGRFVRRKRVWHPGQPGKHYLRNALLEVATRRGFKVIIYDL